jgi:asparagine synthetase B (glutamine-hydrolysing)
MCGIAGFFDARITEPESRDLMGKMLGTLHHRGPDGNYMYVDCPVALGTPSENHRHVGRCSTTHGKG